MNKLVYSAQSGVLLMQLIINYYTQITFMIFVVFSNISAARIHKEQTLKSASRKQISKIILGYVGTRGIALLCIFIPIVFILEKPGASPLLAFVPIIASLGLFLSEYLRNHQAKPGHTK